MCARVTWNVDVTTTIERQPRARASRATARASPRVLYGHGVEADDARARYRAGAAEAAASGQCGVRGTLEIARTGATPRRTSVERRREPRRARPRGRRRRPRARGRPRGWRPDEEDEADDEPAPTTSAATTTRRRRSTARRYPLRP